MIITIANQKGGVAKTHTAAAIASALHAAGKKALAVDADPQGSLSYLLGADLNAHNLRDIIQGTVKTADAIQHTEQADIIAGNKRLSADNVQPDALRKILRPLKYDCIIVDTGPGMSALMLAALAAADLVIIPVKANAGSLAGITDTAGTLATVQGRKKSGCAVLLTQIHARQATAERAFIDAIRQSCESLGLPVYNTAIRYAEAPITSGEAFRQSVIAYDKKSKPAKDYASLLEEMNLL